VARHPADPGRGLQPFGETEEVPMTRLMQVGAPTCTAAG
jgi:hypothetical protein